MKKIYLLAAACVIAISNPVVADDEEHDKKSPIKMDSSMPMHNKEKCEMMSKMKQMKEKHMQTMEQRLANIEGLLKELVELHKEKHSDH